MSEIHDPDASGKGKVSSELGAREKLVAKARKLTFSATIERAEKGLIVLREVGRPTSAFVAAVLPYVATHSVLVTLELESGEVLP